MAEAGKKGNRKLGRQAHHPSHTNYTNSHKCERNKLARILQSNGRAAAEAYVAKVRTRGIVIILKGESA
jgi:hypothetical protein